MLVVDCLQAFHGCKVNARPLSSCLQGISKQALQEDDVQRIINVSLHACLALLQTVGYVLNAPGMAGLLMTLLPGAVWPEPCSAWHCLVSPGTGSAP